MRATLLLCDAADEVGGKLYILGGGWTHSSAIDRPMSMALAITVAVPADEAGREHKLSVVLLTEDGQPVGAGDTAIAAEGTFQVQAPTERPSLADVSAAFALSFHGVALEEGRYEWQLSVDQVTLVRAAFAMRPD